MMTTTAETDHPPPLTPPPARGDGPPSAGAPHEERPADVAGSDGFRDDDGPPDDDLPPTEPPYTTAASVARGFVPGDPACLNIGWALDRPPLDFVRVFGSDAPVELEIGCGRGRFLCNAATARPGTNFLGIERSRKFARVTAEAVAERGLRNVRLMDVDAGAVVRHHLAAGSLAAVHVYYPDPWPKRRHEKRRVMQPDMAEGLRRVLRPGGRLYFQSDVRPYFVRVEAMLRTAPGWRILAAGEIPADTRDADLAGTHWQAKSFRAGLSAWRLVAETTGAPTEPGTA